MFVDYDSQARALYIRLKRRKVAWTAEVMDGVLVDYDRSGAVCGVEMLVGIVKAASSASRKRGLHAASSKAVIT